MQQFETENPWKQAALQAADSLAHLDVVRLEEVAASCRAFEEELSNADRARTAALAARVQDAARAVVLLGRVLETTRANLLVLESVQTRARLGMQAPLEYERPHYPMRSTARICFTGESHRGHN